MIDSYFSANSYELLAGMLTGTVGGRFQILYPNILAPQQGREDAGDAALWYVGIRNEDAITPPEGVSVCDPATGAAVLGVWA